MKILKRITLILPVLLVLTCACNQRKADYSEFAQFYDKFLQDSLFQIQHIRFPLAGLPDNAVSYEMDLNQFRWTAENWRMHHPIDLEKIKMQRSFQTLGEGLVIENIVDPSAGFGIVRRWAKIGGEWNLIYYAGMNPLQ